MSSRSTREPIRAVRQVTPLAGWAVFDRRGAPYRHGLADYYVQRTRGYRDMDAS